MTGKPLSILHVLAPADFGGLESVVLALARGHAAMGHAVRVAAVLDRESNQFVSDARDAGLDVQVIDSPPRSWRPERRGVKQALTARRTDVLHSHGYRSDILDIGVARALKIPTVTTLHGFAANDRKARIYEWLELRSVRRASAVVAVSRNVADRALASGVNRESLHLIRNALFGGSVALGRAAARATLGLGDGLNIGWVGRLSEEKGPDVMIDAIRDLRDVPVTLSFIGDGPDLAALNARAAAAGVSDRVRFLGRVPRAATLLPAFDALVLSSRTEGTPMIILEAMTAEVPIVATRVGGIPDMLSERDALLVRTEDPAALAAAIRTAIQDAKVSRERARSAHDRLRRDFDPASWLAKYEALYRSVGKPNSGSKS